MTFIRLAQEQYDTIPEMLEPSENPLLVGHDEAAFQLAAAYRAGRMHHAILLSGPAGIGKATFAFHLARHLLANPADQNAPAGFQPLSPESALFRQVAQGSHPSVLHLTRPLNEKTKSFRSAVTVDEIRKVNRFLAMTSHDGGWRVAIVDPADDMNTNAANALLKKLEEPPPRTLFVLIANSLGSLLPTIRSRCQLIRLKPLEPDQLLDLLERLNAQLPIDSSDRDALVKRAGGSAREALLLTQFGGIDIGDAMTRVVEARSFGVVEAFRVADAVGGRDASVQFAIFNQMAMDLVAMRARNAALAGDSAVAAKLGELWQEAGRLISETETYNLDKRQHVVGLLRRMQEAMTG